MLASQLGEFPLTITSYIFIAISEIFASITALEYAYTKAPKNMRSLVMAINLFTSAVSAALGEAFVCTSMATPSTGRKC